MLGSCFTENIGVKLRYFKFQTYQNPFGIIFNPVAVEKIITRAVTQTFYTVEDIFEKEGYWHSLEVHSLISVSNKMQYLALLNDRLRELKKWIETATHVIFTFGTAWVYTSNVSQEVVANCHKLPKTNFTKTLLFTAQIVASIEQISACIRSLNFKAQLITTISPVRHLKDGFIENMRNKSHLISAVHQCLEGSERQFYFPSYEIMMDELRDYRFYKSDLIHPNDLAINIIWERFKEAWISKDADKLQERIDAIQKGLLHRSFYPESTQHQAFVKKLKQKIYLLKQELPFIDF